MTRYISLFTLLAGSISAMDNRTLLHAIELRNQAEQAETQACRLPEAIALLQRADSVITQSEPTGPGPDAPAIIQAKIRARINALEARREDLSKFEKRAGNLLGSGRPDTARSELEVLGGPLCAPAIRQAIQDQTDAASAFRTRARQQHDARKRLDLLEKSLQKNREAEGIVKEVTDAQIQVANLPCGACKTAKRVVKRTVITAVVVGGVGAGAIYGRQMYLRRQR